MSIPVYECPFRARLSGKIGDINPLHSHHKECCSIVAKGGGSFAHIYQNTEYTISPFSGKPLYQVLQNSRGDYPFKSTVTATNFRLGADPEKGYSVNNRNNKTAVCTIIIDMDAKYVREIPSLPINIYDSNLGESVTFQEILQRTDTHLGQIGIKDRMHYWFLIKGLADMGSDLYSNEYDVNTGESIKKQYWPA